MPSPVWKLNGATFAAAGIDDGTLTLVNHAASAACDVLVLTQVLEDNDASESPFAYGAEVTLTRDAAVWFVGTVRDIDESVDRARTITLRGGWDKLERKAYLQNFAAPSDPDDPNSATVTVTRGRVVLGQGDDGLRLPLADFIEQVLDYAEVTIGTIEAGTIEVPFEDATDLSCAELIQRMLRWIPNCVLWFDYSTGEPVINLAPRASLDVETLTIGEGEGVTWAENLRLKPRHDLQVDHVVLQYVATNRANAANWETLTLDVYPPGSTGEEDNALVRTIELGGSVSDRSYLTQEVETAELYDGLDFSGYVTAASNAGAFASLSDFWRKHVPALARGGITIRRFEDGVHTKINNDPVTADLRELTAGGLMEWMQEDDADLVTEQQVVKARITYEVTDAADATKKSTTSDDFTAQIVATNAQTKTYRQLDSASSTEAEEVPVGLALGLYAALHPLQYEGDIPLVEEEASAWPAPGKALNLAGGKAAWATMAALVQARTTRISTGETNIAIGPYADLSATGLVEIYRTNRNRKPSTSYLVRATGKTGGAGGGGANPLPTTQPIRPAQTPTRVPPRTYSATMTVAGAVPTAGNIKTALEGVYSASNPPVVDDTVNLLVSGTIKMRATVKAQGTEAGLFVVKFTVSSVDYYAHLTQTGDY